MAVVRKIFFFCSIVALILGCDNFSDDTPALPDIKPFTKGEKVSRTLLVYLMAENNLTDYLDGDFSEVRLAAYDIPDDVRLFVYFDNSDATRLPALYQYHPYNGKIVENVVYMFDTDVCSSDVNVLGKVLDVVFENYPTEAFDLIMGSHSDGWIRYQSKSAPSRALGVDNGKNDTSNDITKTIEIEELAELLEQQPVKVDRLMFDACLMQGVEVAYALRNAANWIIGSPAEIPAYGAPYDKMVPLFFDTAAGVDDIMYEYKKAYDNLDYAVVLSAVNTSYMQEFANSTSQNVKRYFGVDNTNDYSGCLAYLPDGVYTSDIKRYPSYYDINAVMKRVLADTDYAEWKAVLDKVVFYRMVSNSKKVYSDIINKYFDIYSDFVGLSMYLPRNRSKNEYFNELFRTTEWYTAAGWSEAGW
ncbi:MAG: hypothetical protein IKA52_02840 [Bacteroidaceae bacterium]|nr:hypothetical protein [Bacteroidaceae bacterium]